LVFPLLLNIRIYLVNHINGFLVPPVIFFFLFDLLDPILDEEYCNEFLAHGISTELCLPQSFGNIFVGESFVSYISLHNHSPFDVRNVSIKAELQTSTQRVCLLEIGPNAFPLFNSGESHDYVVSHDLKENSIHILVCAVNYLKHDNEKKSFRKFFKFQVLNPFEISTKIYDLQHGNFLSAQIQNTTQQPLFIEAVKFDPSLMFTAFDLSVNDDHGGRKQLTSLLGDITYFNPQDIRQYLFRLEARHDSRAAKVEQTHLLDKISYRNFHVLPLVIVRSLKGLLGYWTSRNYLEIEHGRNRAVPVVTDREKVTCRN